MILSLRLDIQKVDTDTDTFNILKFRYRYDTYTILLDQSIYFISILYREVFIRFFLRYYSFSNRISLKLSSNVKDKATRKHITAFCSHCNHHRFWLFHHFQQDGIVTRTTRLFLISRDSKLEWKYNRGSLLRHCYLFEAVVQS